MQIGSGLGSPASFRTDAYRCASDTGSHEYGRRQMQQCMEGRMLAPNAASLARQNPPSTSSRTSTTHDRLLVTMSTFATNSVYLLFITSKTLLLHVDDKRLPGRPSCPKCVNCILDGVHGWMHLENPVGLQRGPQTRVGKDSPLLCSSVASKETRRCCQRCTRL